MCGKSLGNRPIGNVMFPECEECGNRREAGERVRLLFAERRRHVESQPPEERFGGLFESAGVLLEERAGEDRVLPILAMEGLISRDGELGGWAKIKRSLLQAWGDAKVWETEKSQVVERTGTVTPVKVVRSAVTAASPPLLDHPGDSGHTAAPKSLVGR